jgi:hypothetical protein
MGVHDIARARCCVTLGVLVPDDNRCSDACRAVLVPEREAAITHAGIDHGPDGVTPGTTLACGLLTAQSEYGGDAAEPPPLTRSGSGTFIAAREP